METVGDGGGGGEIGVDKGSAAAGWLVLIIHSWRNNVALQNPGRGSRGK